MSVMTAAAQWVKMEDMLEAMFEQRLLLQVRQCAETRRVETDDRRTVLDRHPEGMDAGPFRRKNVHQPLAKDGCTACHGIEGSGGTANPGSVGGFVPGFLGISSL